MTIEDEVLSRLLAGEDYKTIYSELKGKKPLYEAFNEWFDITEKQYDETRRKQKALDSKIKESRIIETTLNKNVKTLQGQAKDLEDVEGRIVDAEKFLQKTQQKLEEVKTQIRELKENGFTPKVLALALRIDVEATGFLKRLETGKAFNDLILELRENRENLKKALIEETDTKTRITRLLEKEKAIADEVRSQTNVLDDLQSKTRGYRDAVMVVRGFFSQSYSVTDLQSLRRGIDMLGIKGDPERSLQRVFESIKREGLLSGLNDSITSRRTELKTLKENIAKKHGELQAVLFAAKESSKAIPNMIDEAIKDVKAEALNELTEVAAKSINELEAVGEKAQIKLGDTQKTVNSLSNDFKRGTKNTLSSVDVEISKSVSNAVTRLNSVMGKLEKVFEANKAELDKYLTTTEVEVRKTLKKTDAESRKNMANVVSNAVSQLNSVTGKIEGLFEAKKAELDKYLKMREWMAEYEPILQNSKSFVALMDDPSLMTLMPPQIILKLSMGVEAYVKKHCSKELIEETLPLVRDRNIQTTGTTYQYFEHKQTFTFSKVTAWCMKNLRKYL